MKPETNNAIDFLRSLPVFKDVPASTLEKLAEATQSRKVPRNGTIYRAGDPSNTVFFLVRGTVKIGSNSNDGREVIKQILHPVTMFGELGLIGEENRKDFATALNEEVLLYTISIDAFRRLMHNHQELALQLLRWVGNRLRRTEDRLESLIFKDARERIIDFLKESARRRGQRVGYEMLIRHSLTQQDIANITGTSRQTVTSVLNDLRKSNLIYFNRRTILIRDMGKLG